MKILNCPLNGPRNVSEFVCYGEVLSPADPRQMSDEAWADSVFFSNNVRGVVREWWCHVPTAYWFIAERNTVTDEVLRSYPASEVFATRIDFLAEGGPAVKEA